MITTTNVDTTKTLNANTYNPIYPDTFYRTGQSKIDYTKFAGVIYPSDFNGNPTMADEAKSILKADSFNESCRRNLKNRNRSRKAGN